MRQPRHYGGAFFCKGAPGGAQSRRLGSVGERRRSEMSELSALVGSEGYGACADEGEGGEERGVGGIGERGEGA